MTKLQQVIFLVAIFPQELSLFFLLLLILQHAVQGGTPHVQNPQRVLYTVNDYCAYGLDYSYVDSQITDVKRVGVECNRV